MSSSIVKWAVAAVLALPAIPLLARTPSSTSVRPAARLSTAAHHARRYHHRARKHSLATTHTKKHHRVTHARRRSGMASLSARPALHLTHTPPTIDGIRS
jgi:hypothetical protein